MYLIISSKSVWICFIILWYYMYVLKVVFLDANTGNFIDFTKNFVKIKILQMNQFFPWTRRILLLWCVVLKMWYWFCKRFVKTKEMHWIVYSHCTTKISWNASKNFLFRFVLKNQMLITLLQANWKYFVKSFKSTLVQVQSSPIF